MKQHVARGGAAVLAAGVTLGLGMATVPALANGAGPEADEDYKVLVVGKTLGFRHSHIPHTTEALIDLGEDHGFTVDVWDPDQEELTFETTPFTSAEDLSQYATIVFNSPVDGTNDMDPERERLLDDDELEAFQGYIRSGGGFVGIHAATDTMHAVPWFSELTGGGARFAGHPHQQDATMHVESPTHPSTSMLPTEWPRFDEWYNYTTNPREDVHVLMTLDESTYDPGRGAMGEDHPLAWCHNFEGARSWYTGAGHTEESWSDPLFLGHVLGGVEWSAGVVSGGGDCVTFPEVEGILDEASGGSDELKAEIGALLASAQDADAAGDNDGAVGALVQAASLATAFDGTQLAGKINDLLEWQGGLTEDGGHGDQAGIPVHATVPELEDGSGGSLTMSIADFGNSVDLGQALNSGDRFRFIGELPTVSVSDSRAVESTEDGWTVSGQTTDFDHSDGELSGSHLGWAPGQLSDKVGVTPGTPVATELSGGPGLALPATLASAVGEGRLGSTELGADLVLEVPVDTTGGVYTSTVTLSLFPVD